MLRELELYRIDQMEGDALSTAIEAYKASACFHYYKEGTPITEAIADDRICFNEDGSIFGEYRTCSHCGCDMVNGYVIGDGEEYYCSDECLHEHYTEEEYTELCRDDFAYYTEWY